MENINTFEIALLVLTVIASILGIITAALNEKLRKYKSFILFTSILAILIVSAYGWHKNILLNRSIAHVAKINDLGSQIETLRKESESMEEEHLSYIEILLSNQEIELAEKESQWAEKIDLEKLELKRQLKKTHQEERNALKESFAQKVKSLEEAIQEKRKILSSLEKKYQEEIAAAKESLKEARGKIEELTTKVKEADKKIAYHKKNEKLLNEHLDNLVSHPIGRKHYYAGMEFKKKGICMTEKRQNGNS